MSYVYDGTSLPSGKSDARPPARPSSQQVSADEWNTAMQAIDDLRTALLTGDYHGLSDNPTAALSASGKAVLRMKGGVVEASVGGDRFRRLFEPSLLNVADYGAKGDSSTDDTAAIQAAVDALPAWGGSVFFPAGTYKVTSSINITKPAVTFRGVGTSSSIINYTPTSGACIKLGTYQPASGNYGGGAQGFGLRDIRLSGSYDATAASPSGTPYGVVDYECGGLLFHNVMFSGFYTGLWGISSDINHICDALFRYCEVGIDLRSRSDQQVIRNLYGYGNYTLLRLSSVCACTVDHLVGVENIGPDVIIQGNSGTESDPLGGGDFTGLHVFGCKGVSLDNCWFEDYGNTQSGGAYPRGQPTKSCFIEVGAGQTSHDAPVANTHVTNVYVTTVDGGTKLVANCLVRTRYAVETVVDGVTYQSRATFPVMLAENVSAYAGTGSDANNTVFQFGSGRVEGFVYRDDETTTTHPPITGGGLRSPCLSTRPPGARSILGNPLLRGNAMGATIGNASIAAYSAAAGENLIGNAITITPSAQFGGMYMTKLRLHAGHAYRVVARCKTTGTGAWQLKIEASGGGLLDNTWQRQLAGVASLSEFAFTIVAPALPTNPQLSLIYLGTTLTDTCVVDYVDVQELGPTDGHIRGQRREVFASAAPTSGNWDVGDVVWNAAPAAGGTMGWVCTTAGSPGTWKTFGTIGA